jgi:hypothetical protein
MKYFIATVFAILLAACSDKHIVVDGVYVDSAGKDAFTFTSDGKVHWEGKVTKYAITDGKTVSFHFEDGIPLQGKVAQDGSIVLAGMIFSKK